MANQVPLETRAVPRPHPARPLEGSRDESLFQALIEHTEDIVTVVGGDGRILYDNPAVERVLGYPQGELVGRNAFELVHGDDLSTAFALLTRTAARPGATASLTFRFQHRDGSWRWLASVGRVLPSATEPKLVITSRDVTAQMTVGDRRWALGSAAPAPEEADGEMERVQLEMLERLARAAEVRDDETGQHTRRVGELSAALAKSLGLSDADVEIIRRAAPLHDLGKIGIRDSILLKPGPLSAEELEIMRTHTVLGARLLSQGRSNLVRAAEVIALHHHERWDGAGYPTGLIREGIPLAARIVTVVDYYDALTHARPYRPAWPTHAVVRAIQDGVGTLFDPTITKAFLSLVSDQASV